MKRIAIAIAIATCAFGAAAQDKPNPLDVVPDKMPNDIPYGTPITLERAQAAVNAGANLVSFARMDGAQLGSIQIAEHKARASVKYRRETKAFEGGVQGGNLYLLSLDDVIASRGGIPLMD